jgi:hypothetical protein
MNKDLFLEYMDMWARWMRSEDNKLGFPRKSLGINMSSSTSFDDMLDEADNQIIQVINSSMDSLSSIEIDAIWARYLKTKKPMYYEVKLDLALEKLMDIVESRIEI